MGFAPDDAVQAMETWIVADAGAFAGYYVHGSSPRKLSNGRDLERVVMALVQCALKEATEVGPCGQPPDAGSGH